VKFDNLHLSQSHSTWNVCYLLEMLLLKAIVNSIRLTKCSLTLTPSRPCIYRTFSFSEALNGCGCRKGAPSETVL